MAQLFILNLDEQVTTTLSDAVIVTDAAPLITATCHEELAGLTELKFSTAADSIEAGLIREDYYVVVNVNGVFKEFIIDNVVDSDETDLIKEVSASLSAVELNDSIITDVVTGNSGSLVLAAILKGTRWTVGDIDPTIRNIQFTQDVQYQTVLEALNTFAEAYNCTLFYSYVIDENKVVRRQVNLFKQLGSDTGKRFEVDKDITSIKREIDTTQLATAILPIKKEQADGDSKETVLTLANISYTSPDGNGTSPKGQLFISDKRAKENWGRLDSNGKVHDRVKLYEYTDENVDINRMAELAWLSLGQYTAPKVTYEANVIDLFALLGPDYRHEKVVLGDTVTVIDRYFTVPIEIKEQVIEIDHDLIDPAQTAVTLGSKKGNYNSDRSRAEAKADTALNAANTANNNATIAIISADGKNTIYFGTEPPVDPHENDIWFKPNPDDPTIKIMQRWDGVQWVDEFAEFNSGELEAAIADATKAGEDAAKAAAAAEQAGKDAALKADDARKAGQAAADLADQASKDAEAATGKANEAVASFNALDGTVKGLQTTVGNKADKSLVTQLQSDINLRVHKGDVINQINVGGESILIAGNKLHITANTSIDNAIIQTAHIKDLSVNTAKIADSAIGTAKIGDLAVTNAKLANLSVTEGKIGNAAITTAKIKDAAITSAKIGNAAITTAKIKDASISSAKIISLDAAKITASSLSSISANIGTITAGLLQGKNMTLNLTSGVLDIAAGSAHLKQSGDTFTITSGSKRTTLGAESIALNYNKSLYGPSVSFIPLSTGFEIQGHGTRTATGTSGSAGIRGAGNNASIFGGQAMFYVGMDDKPRVWSPAIYGRTYSGQNDVCITPYGTLGRRSSARKYKTDIQPLSLSRWTTNKRILYMQPVSWQDKAEIRRNGVSQRYYGFVADDFHDAGLTEVVQYGSDGQVEGLSYDRLSIYTLPILKEHEEKIISLSAVYNQHDAEINVLKAKVENLEKEIEALRSVA